MWIKFIKNTGFNKKDDVVDVGKEIADEYIKQGVAKESKTVSSESKKVEEPTWSDGPAVIDGEIIK